MIPRLIRARSDLSFCLFPLCPVSLQHLTHPSPLELVHEGRLLRRNMERELITEEDLMTQVRKQGAEDLTEVEKAFLEGDGHISVIKKEPEAKKNDQASAPRRGRKKGTLD